MDGQIVTVATHKQGLFESLINNKFNENVKVLGFDQKWTGFKMKVELIYEYIQNLPDETIILFLDGFDSTINGSLEEAIKIFKTKDCKILFSNDSNSDFIIPGLANLVFPNYEDGVIINSGMYIGYVKFLKILFKEHLKENCNDDQVVINRISKKFDFIKVDVDESIFKNIIFHKTLEEGMKGSNALYFSQPCTLSVDRVKRIPFEYGQYLFPYILLIYFSSIILLCKEEKYNYMLLLSIFLGLFYYKMDKSDL